MSALSHTKSGSEEAAIGESETCNHASMMVAFPKASNPVMVTEFPCVFTGDGPTQEEVAAVVNGARSIRSTRAPARLLRSADMSLRGFRVL